jgi:hypothetical protein
MNSFYIYVSSDDSSQYYKNKPYDFTVYLPESLKFKGRQTWEVGLAETQYTLSGDFKSNMIEVYTDMTSSSIIHGRKKPVLRALTIQNLTLKALTLHKNPNPIFYIPVNKNDLRQVRVYILTSNGKPATCLTGVTRCTLHFRRVYKGINPQ